jgi:DNA polymerase V
MKQPLFALIDCNNFFVSCERLFRPDLEDRPVVVLSSNDGCAVSRSNEAKSLGIPMGAPAFKYRDFFKQYGVVQFSANFELYGDISRRITELLSTITPRIEVYSVDESFLDLSELPITDYTTWGREVQQRIWRWIGIPVSIGIAPTKTLAKLASDKAKKDPELNGVLDLIHTSEQLRRQYLERTPIQDIWGIGWRLAPALRGQGIANAEQLRQLAPRRAQQLMGIRGRQLITELNGISCHALELEGRLAQSIARTRTFGEDTSEAYAVEAALATFTSQAAYRLRESGQLTRRAGIFLTTSKHKPGYHRWSKEVIFDVPTADAGSIAQTVADMFSQLYIPTIKYHRAGVLLHDFVPAGQLQTDLFGTVDVPQHTKADQRMAAVDVINRRFGKRTVRLAAEELAAAWKPKYQLRSSRYVTRWSELPIAHPTKVCEYIHTLRKQKTMTAETSSPGPQLIDSFPPLDGSHYPAVPETAEFAKDLHGRVWGTDRAQDTEILHALRDQLIYGPLDPELQNKRLYQVALHIGEGEIAKDQGSMPANQLLASSKPFMRTESFHDINDESKAGQYDLRGRAMGLHLNFLDERAKMLRRDLEASDLEWIDKRDAYLVSFLNTGAHETGHAILSGISRLTEATGTLRGTGLASCLYTAKHPEESLTGDFMADAQTNEERFATGFGDMVVRSALSTLGYSPEQIQQIMTASWHQYQSENLPPDSIQKGALGYLHPLSREKIISELTELDDAIQHHEVDVLTSARSEWDIRVAAAKARSL